VVKNNHTAKIVATENQTEATVTELIDDNESPFATVTARPKPSFFRVAAMLPFGFQVEDNAGNIALRNVFK